jgi:hypothetical protein
MGGSLPDVEENDRLERIDWDIVLLTDFEDEAIPVLWTVARTVEAIERGMTVLEAEASNLAVRCIAVWCCGWECEV